MNSDLYDFVIERAGGRCEIPWCVTPRPKLEVAHLTGKQMGGSKYRDHPDNLAAYCKDHHDILDGRVDVRREMFSMQYERTMMFRYATGRFWKEQR